MATEPTIMPGAEPFSAAGDRRGALVIHGFTGCPQSMRPLGQAFAASGFTVEVPRLPGHGTTVEDMAHYTWRDWTAAADDAYRALAEKTDGVIVAGLSMGGTLTLWLAQRYPQIRGIVLINPAAEVDDFSALGDGVKAMIAGGQQFMPGVAGDIADPDSKELGYDRVPLAGMASLIDGLRTLKPALPQIKMPALLLHSVQDHVVPAGSPKLLRETLGGPVDYVALQKSYHVATIDYEGAEINQRAVAFAERVLR
ncbi:carboxylesterase [Reyranella sp. CPCC 100927]|uniref:alpha/beta hydrolase n=1 Tax=Reyranella sp. CPCC 100927 TaxID=2599616 RepID=UPI0011B4077E|nr:alpha/beta fold hydrolase [Reyranella sp. CPCC 100927]TWT15551.1 alpha/beta fold hydrolase [Reyranella sp. CPCC 100927]